MNINDSKEFLVSTEKIRRVYVDIMVKEIDRKLMEIVENDEKEGKVDE